MDIWGALVALGGLAVTAWSTYLASRSRTQPLRDLLYARQVDLGIDFLSAASDFHTDVSVMIDAAGGERKSAAIDALVQTSSKHWPLHARLMALAPADVAAAWRVIDDLVLRAIADSNNDALLRARYAELWVL